MLDPKLSSESSFLKIKNQKDFWAGVMFAGFGSFFFGFGSRYAMGSTAKMGPGYFPTVLGVLLLLLGIAIVLSSVSPKARSESVDKFSWKALGLILGPVILFGVLLQSLGLIVNLLLLVILSSFASHEFRWTSAMLNALTLTVLSYIVFVWALKLQFPLWPAFLGQ